MYLVSDLESNGYTYDTIGIGSLGHYTTSTKNALKSFIHDVKLDVLKLLNNLAKYPILVCYIYIPSKELLLMGYQQSIVLS